MAERKRKLELLVRKNQAKRQHPYYLTELSHVLKQPITKEDLVDLDMTDNLLSQYNQAAKRADPQWSLKATWPFEPNSRWLRVCFCIAEQLASEPVALFAGPYNTCGAVRTKAEHPLVSALSVLAFDRDTLRIHSLKSDGGLYLDLYEEKSTHWIELKVWGDWPSRVEKCLTQTGPATAS